MMLRVLRFAQHLSAHVLDGERVFVLGGDDPHLLVGRGIALVAPLLDGRRTVGEVAAALEGSVPLAEILHALITLERRGYVVEGSTPASPGIAAFWEAQGALADRAAARLHAAPVRVYGESPALVGAVAEAIRAAGVEVDGEAPFHVVVVADYLDAALDAVNRRALDQGFSWVPVKLGALATGVGPVFRPGAGPCWACLAHRLRQNRPVEVYLQRHARAAQPPRTQPEMPALLQAGAGLAATAVARWIVDDRAFPLDDLMTIDLARFAADRHPVVRRPQCKACGDPALVASRAHAPVLLQSRPKRFTADGGHRTIAPDQTLERLSSHVDPLVGIVTSVGPVPERDHPLRPVYASAARVCPAHEAPSFEAFHRVTMGKGRTAAQSRASALCEAIERHTMRFQGDEPRRRARLDELGGEGIHPDELQNFSEAQLRRRTELNAEVGALGSEEHQLVPVPFDPAVAVDWSPAWSLTHARRRWVPTAFCYANMPVAPEARFCHANANGHAAGNCLEEAILQGFCELVERDAVAIWWYNRLCRPAVDLASFGEPYFTDLVAHYRALGFHVWVLDVTTDLGIPTFVAVGLPEGGGRWHMGFGCHLEARLGVQRALTELNQLFDTSEDGPVPWEPRGLTTTDFLHPHEATPPRTVADFPDARHDDVRDDVLDLVARAARAGMETLVLDQTHPDIELCTVKVIVPGLRHFWPRFGPGRLYDVPVAMGLVDRPLSEADLNPSALKF